MYNQKPFREALAQYKEAHKVLFGFDLTSVSLKTEQFDAFLKETLGGLDGVSVVTTTFSVDGISVLQTTGA